MMNPGTIITAVLMALAAMCLLVMAYLFASLPAEAADNLSRLPEGLGHPPNHTEYFDGNCCNNNDCEMVPDQAITETKDGYKIRYWTQKYGGMIVEGFVPHGQERMSKRCTETGECTGVCSYPQYKPTGGTGTFGTMAPDYSKPAFVRCLYVMPST